MKPVQEMGGGLKRQEDQEVVLYLPGHTMVHENVVYIRIYPHTCTMYISTCVVTAFDVWFVYV